jgi:predicted nucleic acid-binding protein
VTTFDTGVLIALDRDDRRAWAILRRLVDRGEVPIVPSAVLAQSWRSGRRQARLARVLHQCRIIALDDDRARAAGELCGRAGTADIVDAAVVATAAETDGVVITGDATELRHLAGYLRRGQATIVAFG